MSISHDTTSLIRLILTFHRHSIIIEIVEGNFVDNCVVTPVACAKRVRAFDGRESILMANKLDEIFPIA
jgi:hypothetical protein